MNILIIARLYHSRKEARAIQMRRVINSIKQYTSHNYTLITEGKSELTTQDGFQLINIKPKKELHSLLEKGVDHILCSPFCIRNDHFYYEAIKKSQTLIDEKKIDLLLTVSTPFDCHLIGLELKRKNRQLKWISFFSDIWPTSTLPNPYKKKKLLSFLEKNKMQKVLENCDILLTPSDYAIISLRELYNTPSIMKSIPHCSIEPKKNSFPHLYQLDGFIVHSGFLQKERIKEDLIVAVKELGEELPNFKGLFHIGAYDSSLPKLLTAKKCKNIFLLGSLPQDTSSLFQKMAGITLIIEAPMGKISPFMPSKITDCVTNSQKVVTISPQKSFLNDFAKKHNGFFSCEYEKEAIKKTLRQVFESPDVILDNASECFEPKSIAQNYDQIFNLIK